MWIRRMVEKTHWGQLMSLVSPGFFEVLPTRSLSKEVGALMKASGDRARFEAKLEQRQPLMDQLGWRRGSRGEHLVSSAGAFGEDLLAFYFAQLFAYDDVLPDLRSISFKQEDGTIQWGPRVLYVEWEPDFIHNVRRLYEGFYEPDDAGFEAALDALGLPGTGDLFREHFGGQQHAVDFALSRFQGTFQRIFDRCRRDGLTLHRQFVSFGIYLGTLYENLDRAEQPFDVSRAYRRGRDLAASVG
jgi:hypothetical protein